MSRLKTFLFNGILLTLTTLLIRAIGFGFNVYISNKIGSEALGVFQLILTVYMFFTTLSTSGINLAVIRIVTEELAINPSINTKKPMLKCLKFSLITGIIAGLLLFISAPFISNIFLHNRINHYIFYIISISLPFISLATCFNGYFTALRKNGKNAINKVLEQFVKITSTAYLLSLFMPNGLNYACFCLVLGEAISEIASCIIAFVLYIIEKRNCDYRYTSKTNYTKKILNICLPVAFTSYIRSGLVCIKQVLIPLRLEKFGLSCSKAMSCYGIINGMVLPVLMFPELVINSFSGLLIPEFTYFYAKNDYSKISSVLSRIFRITLLFAVGVIGVFLFYSDGISLFIYNNLEVSIYLKILCPLLLFMYLDSIVDSVLKGLDKQVGVMKVNILDLFVSISCIYFLLPIFGVNGYIFVIFVSELLNSCISIFQLYRISKFKIDFKRWIVRPFIYVLLSYFLTELLIVNPCNEPFTFIIKILMFVGSYFLFLLLFEF